jgi:hypothetical protein
MSHVRFATTCDVCGKRSEEYATWPYCRECGIDLCPEHRNHDFSDPETGRTLCANDVGCQLERETTS